MEAKSFTTANSLVATTNHKTSEHVWSQQDLFTAAKKDQNYGNPSL